MTKIALFAQVLICFVMVVGAVAYCFSVNSTDPKGQATPTTDSVPSPKLQVFSPENITYQTAIVPLNVTADNSTSTITYMLDGKENVTVMGNATIDCLSEGVHNMTVYAFDNEGKLGDSENITFTVQLPYPPNTKLTLQQVGETINYFESEGLKIQVLDGDKPQNWLNMGVVNLETKEALAAFATEHGITVLYEFVDSTYVSFNAYVYNNSPLPIIYSFSATIC